MQGSQHSSNEESEVVDLGALKDLLLTSLPTNAGEYRGWKNATLPHLATFDKSGDGRLVAHVMQCLAARG